MSEVQLRKQLTILTMISSFFSQGSRSRHETVGLHHQ